MINAVFFESAGDERGTPQDFFDKLNAEFHFDIDCAASELNHKCELYFGQGGVEFDALKADWAGMTCFLNPPYSIADVFIEKAREEADKGATVVMLLPVRSDTKYWHKYIWDKDRIPPYGGEWSAEHKTYVFDPVIHGLADGYWREGVRFRFLPGRLNFELTVPDSTRAWIKGEIAGGTDIGTVVRTSGLPKMAIQRILEDQPDDCLMDAAPFPSCVVIFTKAH